MANEIFMQIQETNEGYRIDKFLAETDLDMTRSSLQKLIREEQIFVNGLVIKSNYKVNTGDQIRILIPDPIALDILPENISLSILYEDSDIIVIDKPKNMVVHPAAGHYTGTIVNALLFHCKDNLSGINGIMRPGIVHRIDRNTTGAIVVCKNDKAHNSLANQLKEHSIKRRYEAIVYRHFKEEDGMIDEPIGRHPVDRKKMAVLKGGGKKAITHYKVIQNLNKNFAHIACELETGRTHQIRVHMASIQHPLLGDDCYGPLSCPFHLEGQVLHAKILGFIHPSTGEYMEFEAPLPPYFKDLLSKLQL